MISCRAAASAAKLVREAITSPTKRLCCPSSRASEISSAVPLCPLSQSTIRFFSSNPAKSTNQKGANKNVLSKEINELAIDVRSSLPEGYTTGNVLAVITTKITQKGAVGKPLEHDDMRILIEAAKTPKDARLIIGALIHYKHNNNYILTTEMAELAVRRILEADPSEGSFLVLKNFTGRSGLYFSCEIPILNLVLDDILIHASDHDKEELWSALVTMLHLLIYRKSRPFRQMNQKDTKLYHKQIQLHHGPTAEMVEKMVTIGLKIKSVEAVQKHIIEVSQTNRVPILEETLSIVEKLKSK